MLSVRTYQVAFTVCTENEQHTGDAAFVVSINVVSAFVTLCFSAYLSLFPLDLRERARYLQRTIQASTKGHNSTEDAIAALELAQLKLSRGPNFGAERSSDNVFDRLHR